MTAIWSSDQSGSWKLVAPRAFPDETTLHTMVEQAPQMLPLSGEPRLIIVGREVQLGNGTADLIAVEPDGRLVIIEVKLAKNPEARRAVVAQILTYAAYLRGLDLSHLEQNILWKHLSSRGYASLTDAALNADQTESFDATVFAGNLQENLRRGSFRLVLVLDKAPNELVRLVGYLEAVTEGLVIDLITVSSYEVDRAKIVVPQRVDPEAHHQKSIIVEGASTSATVSKAAGVYTEGAIEFLNSITVAAESEQQKLQELADWALSLQQQGLVNLGTVKGIANRWTLLPRLPDTGVGLITIWNEKGASLQFWRSVFEKRAPKTLEKVEGFLAPLKVGKGTTTKNTSPELLAILTEAYQEAAAGITLSEGSTGNENLS